MDLSTLLFFAVLWMVFRAIGKAGRHGGPPSGPEQPDPERVSPWELIVRRSGAPGGPAGRQQGASLDDLFRQLQRTLEQAADARGKGSGGISPAPRGGSGIARRADSAAPPRTPAAARLPVDDEVEERESLETMPETVSLEREVARPRRAVVDLEEGAADAEARRAALAAARDRALTPGDHAAFDARIRQQPADHTGVRGYTAQQLRDAVRWREILGPPVALRGEERDPD
jgi:hypothetical protein